MTDTQLNLLVALIPMGKRHSRLRKKLPEFIRWKLPYKAWWVQNIHAIGLPEQPLTVCTTKPPRPRAESRTLTLPTPQAERLHEFFTRYYTGDPGDATWTPGDFICTIQGTSMTPGAKADLSDLKPGQAYILARDDGRVLGSFMTLPDEPDICLTLSQTNGFVLLIPPRLHYEGHAAQHIYELNPDATEVGTDEPSQAATA